MPVCMSDFISALKIICKKMHSFSIVLQICGTQSQPDLPVHMSYGGGGGVTDRLLIKGPGMDGGTFYSFLHPYSGPVADSK
jgi:hypothetical protein